MIRFRLWWNHHFGKGRPLSESELEWLKWNALQLPVPDGVTGLFMRHRRRWVWLQFTESTEKRGVK